MIRLLLARPELAPTLKVFTQPVVVLGRGGAAGADPDWLLPFADVSRAQCRFTTGGDAVFVEGLSERNATFVNNRRISASTRLVPGDQVRFGACVIRFVGTTPEVDAGSVPATVATGLVVARAPVVAKAPVVARAPVVAPPEPAPEVVVPDAQQPLEEDMSPILEQAQRWELHGQAPHLLLRGEALRRGRAWLRRSSALGGSGVLVRRFVEASVRRRRQVLVAAVQGCGLALATVVGGSATASWIYPTLVLPAKAERPGSASCEPASRERADGLVAAAGQETDGAAALLGVGHALRLADSLGCRSESGAEAALRQRLAGRRARAIGQVEGPARALVLRADGRLAAVADGQGALAIFDLRGEDPPIRPIDAGGPVSHMAWSADLRWLATGGADPEVVLWDTDGQRIDREHALDLGGPATALAFSPDGALLATGDRAGTLRLWDTGGGAIGQALGEEKGLPGAPSRLVFDAAGMRLYGLVAGRVRVWSMQATNAGRRLGGSVQLEADVSVTALAVDLGGHRIVTGDVDGDVLHWKQARGRWTGRMLANHGDEVVQVQIVAERDAVISTAADRSIKLIELSTRGKKGGQPFPMMMTASDEAALQVVVDAAGRRMVTVGSSAAPELWDLGARRGEPIARFAEQRTPVQVLALAQSQALVVTAGEDGSLRAWDMMVDGGSAGARVIGDHKAAIDAFALARSGSTLVSTGRDGPVRVWKIDEHGAPDRLAVLSPRRPIHRLAISADGRWIAGSAENLVHVWDTRLRDAESRSIDLSDHDEEVTHLAFSSSGEWLVTADQKGVVLTWQMAAGGPLPAPSRRVELGAQVGALVVSRERVAVGTAASGQKSHVHAWALVDAAGAAGAVWKHSLPVSALVMHEDGTRLASGSADGSVTVGAWRQGRFERTDNNYNLAEHIEVLAMSPDGGSLAVGGSLGAVAVLSASSPDPRRFKAHEGPVRGLAFVGAADQLLSAGQDGALHWWQLTEVAEPRSMALTGHTGAILGLGVDAGAQVAVSVGADQTLRVWPLTTQGLLRLSCQIAGRDLSTDERDRLLSGPAPPLCGPPR